MDGFQKKIRQSLQYRLSIWLAGCIIGVTLVGVALSFTHALHEANEFQDDQLRQIAALIDDHHLPLTPRDGEDVLVGDDDTRVVVQLLRSTQASTRDADYNFLHFPSGLPNGIQTITARGIVWRLFIKPLTSDMRIAVSQPIAVRDEIAQDSALRTLAPLLLLLPLLIVLIALLTKKMFAPVQRLALQLDRRDEQELGILDEKDLPLEIKPFVAAINRLLVRVERSASVHRRFIADAAHELRSPMTALSLQAERLAQTDLLPEAKIRVATLRQGIFRTQSLVNQLLTLARIQEQKHDHPIAISLQRAIRQVLEDLMPQVVHKKIDLGMNDSVDVHIMADEIELRILIKNLLDNAIRYTPAGGRIELELTMSQQHVRLEINDSGTGIAEQDRERVFDPFYRVLGNDENGSGLGLSIARMAARRIAASIELHHTHASPPHGLSVVIKFQRHHAAPNSV